MTTPPQPAALNVSESTASFQPDRNTRPVSARAPTSINQSIEE